MLILVSMYVGTITITLYYQHISTTILGVWLLRLRVTFILASEHSTVSCICLVDTNIKPNTTNSRLVSLFYLYLIASCNSYASLQCIATVFLAFKVVIIKLYFIFFVTFIINRIFNINVNIHPP